jgi:hypothetical protein
MWDGVERRGDGPVVQLREDILAPGSVHLLGMMIQCALVAGVGLIPMAVVRMHATAAPWLWGSCRADRMCGCPAGTTRPASIAVSAAKSEVVQTMIGQRVKHRPVSDQQCRLADSADRLAVLRVMSGRREPPNARVR